MWGYPCKMEELKDIAQKNGIYLLEDCSHAHGGKYKGKPLGSFGDAAVFSLQGQKIITGGEGGILELPSGNVEKNEKIDEGLKREVKEETNLDVEKIGIFVNTFDYLSGTRKKVDNLHLKFTQQAVTMYF